ncbi:glycerol-3-phosphate ABC transporter permease, partial [Thalassospira xiamenensis]
MYQSKWRSITNHVILILGSLFMILPVWIAFVSSTHTREFLFQNGLQFWFGGHFLENYGAILFDTAATKGRVTALEMLFNSMVLGLGFAIGKVIISMMAAYAIV